MGISLEVATKIAEVVKKHVDPKKVEALIKDLAAVEGGDKSFKKTVEMLQQLHTNGLLG